MTAINIMRLAKSVHLFCDTMASHNGAMIGHAVKCMPLPHIQVAIAVRGPAMAIYSLVRMATAFSCFDHLKSVFADELKIVTANGYHDVELLKNNLDIFAIGMGRDGPAACMFFNHRLHGTEPWQVIDVPYAVVTPTIPEVEFDGLAHSPDPLGSMLNLMQVQCVENPDVVGGRICETIISEKGIVMRSHGDLVRPAAMANRILRSPNIFGGRASS